MDSSQLCNQCELHLLHSCTLDLRIEILGSRSITQKSRNPAKGQELCKNIVNVGVICLIISGSGLYGYLRHQYDTKLYNQEDLNTIHYLIVMVAWVLFGCLLMSTFALLAGLCIIRNVLKGAEHLLVNEKYMGLHCVFFLLAVIGNGLVVCSPLDGVTYYKY
jgi:hypothetical protein